MIGFRKFMIEGNPLARNYEFAKEKRHTAGVSAERTGKSDEENAARMISLKKRLKILGYGYRNTKGMWKGGEENSVIVHAKGTGKRHGKTLIRDIKRLGRKHNQDSVLHHDGRRGTLIGTNKHFGVEKRVRLGRIRFNKSNPKGETSYNPTKPAETRPKFTSMGR